MALARLGIALNLKINGLSQYAGFNFGSMSVFNGVPLGANEDGLFVLESAELDDTVQIDSYFEFVTTDFGIPNSKRIRKALVGYESSGFLLLRVKTNDENQVTYTLRPRKREQKQHSIKVQMAREGFGVYWMFGFANKEGCDFSVDSIVVVPIVLGLGR